MMPPLFIHLLPVGFVFVRTRERKHPTFIIYYLPLALLSFVGANESMMPHIYLLLFPVGFVFVRTRERKHSTLIYYHHFLTP